MKRGPILLACFFCAIAVSTRAQDHQHADGAAVAPPGAAPSEVIEGTLIDAAWFADQDDSDADARIKRASQRLADGMLAAVRVRDGKRLQDVIFLLTDSAAVAPYAGAAVKVEGRTIEGARAIVPDAVYVQDEGKWREVQLAHEPKPSSGELQRHAHSDAAHEHPQYETPGGTAVSQGGAHEHAADSSHRPGHDEAAAGHEHHLAMPPAHPLLVNFTAGLFPAALLAEALGRWRRRASLTSAGWWMLFFAAVSAPFTVIAGWDWYRDVGDMGHWQMAIHPWLGSGVSAAIVALALWRRRFLLRGEDVSRSYFAAGAAILVALAVQGHLGATMSFS